jgi:hypothetical protein
VFDPEDAGQSAEILPGLVKQAATGLPDLGHKRVHPGFFGRRLARH